MAPTGSHYWGSLKISLNVFHERFQGRFFHFNGLESWLRLQGKWMDIRLLLFHPFFHVLGTLNNHF